MFAKLRLFLNSLLFKDNFSEGTAQDAQSDRGMSPEMSEVWAEVERDAPAHVVSRLWTDFFQEHGAEAALELSLRLVKRYPNTVFFASSALKLSRESDQELEVARRLFELLHDMSDVTMGALLQAARILELSSQVSDGEKLRIAKISDQRVDDSPRRYFFQSQRAFRDGDLDLALSLLEKHLDLNPEDREAIILRGVYSYHSFRWGQHAEAIVALKDFPSRRDASSAFKNYESFARFQSIDPLDTDTAQLRASDLESPGAVYEAAIRSAPKPDEAERSGVVMLTGSLALGGAERIKAMTYRHFRSVASDESVNLWLMDGARYRSPSGMFYLSLTGAEKDDIHLIEPAQVTENPFSWLPPYFALRAQSIYEHLERVRPRVFYVSLDEAIVAGGIAAVMSGVPKIVLHCHNMSPPKLHGTDERSFGWDRAYRALLSRSNVTLINVSNAALDDYLQWIGVERIPSQTVVQHNGVDFSKVDGAISRELNREIRQNFSIPLDSPVIGAAIRFNEVKRPILWLKAAKLIHDTIGDSHFIIFGNGPLLEESKSFVKEFGMSDYVHFPGMVSDLSHRLRVLDVMMLASRSEGFPNTLIEAQAAGVVPITFDVGGCRETMVHGSTGLIVQEQTAEALANAVSGLLKDREKLQKMKEKGRAFVQLEFSQERMLDSLQKIVL